MTLILRPSWTEQPQGARAPAAEWQSRGMVALFDVAAGREIVSGARATTNTTVVGASAAGLAAAFAGTNTQRYAHQPQFATTGPMSLVVVADISSFANFTAFIAKQASTTTQCPYELRFGSANDQLSFLRGAAGVNGSDFGSLGLTAPVKTLRLVVTADQGLSKPNCAAYIPGRKLTTAANAGLGGVTDNGTSDVIIGTRSDSFTKLNGSLYFVALFNRELSGAEAKELVDNPWQLFTPRRIWVPVSAAAVYTIPSLTTSTYVIGSITTTGWRPMITAS